MARLVVGSGDSVTIYSRFPQQLPVRALDRAGRDVALPPVTFARSTGDSIQVSPTGAVTCLAPGRAEVTATAGAVVSRLMVRCRPVGSIRLAGPLDILLGDSSRRLRPEVLGMDGKPLDGIVAGSSEVQDRAVAVVEGDRLIPRAPGGTLVTVTVGDESVTIGVHVYREVATLDDLGPEENHVAVPLRLGRGDARRWPLPAGDWMIAMQPNDSIPRDLQFAVEGAGCESGGFPKGRIVCLSKKTAHLLMALPSGSSAATLDTRLLLRRTAPGTLQGMP